MKEKNNIKVLATIIILMAIFYFSIVFILYENYNITTNTIKINTTSIKIPKINVTKINLTKLNITKINVTKINTTKINITKPINITKVNSTNITKTNVNKTKINTTNNTKISNVIFLYPSQTSYYYTYVPIFGNKTEVAYICNGLNMTFYNYNGSNIAFENFSSIYTFKGQMEYAKYGYNHPKEINKNNLIYYCN